MKRYGAVKAACYTGYIVQAVINNFLPVLFVILQGSYHLSYEKLGRLIFVNFMTQLLADLTAPLIVKRIGYRGAAILSHALASTGLIGLWALSSLFPGEYITLFVAVVVYAFGSGLIEVIISPMVELLPSRNKATSMAFLHSFYCWGQMLTIALTTYMVWQFGDGNWSFIPLIWAVIPLANVFAFCFVPVVEPDPEVRESTAKELFSNRTFLCFAVFMLCAGASEIAMAEWASAFVQRGLGLNKAVGDLLGPCTFALFMGIGRTVFGVFAGRYSAVRMLIFNNALCVVCYIVAGLCSSPVPVLVAGALCGFSVSLSWPGTYSLAAARFPHGGTLMFSFFALFGDIGCSIGPWVLGAVADRFSLQSGFLVASVFPLLFIAAALLLPKEKDCKTE